MRIDIRDTQEEEVSEICFADHEDYVGSVLQRGPRGSFNIVDNDFDRPDEGIRAKDIDSLIKALQKAKELWV